MSLLKTFLKDYIYIPSRYFRNQRILKRDCAPTTLIVRGKKMASRLCFNIGFLIVASVGLLHGAYAANTYTVGGDLGWIVPPNNTYYEEWTSQRTFQIGDTFGKHFLISL
jgi:hypothetical protein